MMHAGKGPSSSEAVTTNTNVFFFSSIVQMWLKKHLENICFLRIIILHLLCCPPPSLCQITCAMLLCFVPSRWPSLSWKLLLIHNYPTCFRHAHYLSLWQTEEVISISAAWCIWADEICPSTAELQSDGTESKVIRDLKFSAIQAVI